MNCFRSPLTRLAGWLMLVVIPMQPFLTNHNATRIFLPKKSALSGNFLQSEAYSTWQFAAKIQNRNYITALATVGIEFSCIQRRKYFGDSVSCRKCILCDRDATGALGPRIHTSGLDLCLCICPLPKMHTRQAQKRNVVNIHFLMLFVEGQKLF